MTTALGVAEGCHPDAQTDPAASREVASSVALAASVVAPSASASTSAAPSASASAPWQMNYHQQTICGARIPTTRPSSK
jgi:hypothetical protein